MTTLQIASFLSAARNKSFTKAAEELFTSQPTISRQIALLEEEIGFPLFFRDKKMLTLTSGGRVMQHGLQHVLDDIDECTHQAKQSMIGLEGGLAVGYLFDTDRERFIHPFVLEFSRLSTKIEISMESGSYGFLREKLDSGELDVVFTFHFELPAYAGVEYCEYCTVDNMFIISKDHPLASKPDLSPEDLLGEPHYLPDPRDSNGREDDIHMILESIGVDSSGLQVEHKSNLESVLFAVRTGKGFAMTDSSMNHAKSEMFKQIPIPLREDLRLKLYMVWKKDNPNPCLPLLLEFWKAHYDPSIGGCDLIDL